MSIISIKMTIYNYYYAVANKFPVSNFGPISKLNITPIKVSLKECCVYVAADCGSISCQSAEGTFHTSPEWNPPPISNIIHTDKIILKRKVRFYPKQILKMPARYQRYDSYQDPIGGECFLSRDNKGNKFRTCLKRKR